MKNNVDLITLIFEKYVEKYDSDNIFALEILRNEMSEKRIFREIPRRMKDGNFKFYLEDLIEDDQKENFLLYFIKNLNIYCKSTMSIEEGLNKREMLILTSEIISKYKFSDKVEIEFFKTIESYYYNNLLMTENEMKLNDIYCKLLIKDNIQEVVTPKSFAILQLLISSMHINSTEVSSFYSKLRGENTLRERKSLNSDSFILSSLLNNNIYEHVKDKYKDSFAYEVFEKLSHKNPKFTKIVEENPVEYVDLLMKHNFYNNLCEMLEKQASREGMNGLGLRNRQDFLINLMVLDGEEVLKLIKLEISETVDEMKKLKPNDELLEGETKNSLNILENIVREIEGVENRINSNLAPQKNRTNM